MICVRGLVCACALLLLGIKDDVGCVSDADVLIDIPVYCSIS